MKVILIEEENHGFIGCAKDYKSSIHFLIKDDWLTDSTEVWDEEKISPDNPWSPITEVLDKNWKGIIENRWDISDFNNFFSGIFLLHEIKVYED